jgi:DNA-directed RNA polymerase specialized sigma24 family protein
LGAALERLVVCCLSFDDSRGRTAKDYVVSNIYYAMIDEMRSTPLGRSARRIKLGYRPVEYISMSAKVRGTSGMIEVEDTLVAPGMSSDSLDDWLDLLRALGAPERPLVRNESVALAHWMLGWPSCEIAEMLGVTQSRVSQILDSAFKKVWPDKKRNYLKGTRRDRVVSNDSTGSRSRLAA